MCLYFFDMVFGFLAFYGNVRLRYLEKHVLIHLLVIFHRVQPLLCPTFHVLLLSHLDLQAPPMPRLPKDGSLFCSLLAGAGATIMSTKCTPSLSRDHSMSFVILFSMYASDVSNTIFHSSPSTRLIQALSLTVATWKVRG